MRAKIVRPFDKLRAFGKRAPYKSHLSLPISNGSDEVDHSLHGITWYRLKGGTPIPKALAITQDNYRSIGNHYTIAPKDEMEVGLFFVWLNDLAKNAIPV